MTLPTFLIIGSAKSGTTTLYDLLKQHPQIYMSFAKEPLFFSKDDYYEKGLEWYEHTFFRASQAFSVRGEATPHYLYWSEKVAPRLFAAQSSPPFKLIVIFRDPVKRAYSWYWNSVREGFETETFETALALEPERLKKHSEFHNTGQMLYGYFRGGCYASLLKPYLDLFSPEQFLFILQEDLNKDFFETCKKMTKFLNIDENVAIQPAKRNPAALPRSRAFHDWLTKRNNTRDWLKTMIPLNLRYMVKQKLLNTNLQPVTYPEMDPGTEAVLRARYVEENLALSKIINRDLSAWLPQ